MSASYRLATPVDTAGVRPGIPSESEAGWAFLVRRDGPLLRPEGVAPSG